MVGQQPQPPSAAQLKDALTKLRTRGVGTQRIDDLEPLTRVARALVREGGTTDRITATLSIAIAQWDPSDWQYTATRLWFGIEPAENDRPPSLAERHAAAHAHYGKGERSTFVSHRWEEIRSVLATRLRELYVEANASGSTAGPPKADPSKSDHQDPETTQYVAWHYPMQRLPLRMRVSYIRMIGGFALLAAVVATLLVIGLRHRHAAPRPHTGPSQPSPGTIIDLTSGKPATGPVPHQLPALDAAQLQGGHIVRYCNLSEHVPCTYRPITDYTDARPDDLFDIRIRLYNRVPSTIPYLSVRFSASPIYATPASAVKAPRLMAQTFISWFHASVIDNAPATVESPKHPDIMFFRLPAPYKYGSLRYVAGSSRLLSGDGRHVLARLPDGVMDETGLKFSDLGSNTTCEHCPDQFARVVDFRVRVSAST